MAYNKTNSSSQKKTGRKKLKATPGMQELIPTSNIELENGIVYIYNGQEDPIEAKLSGAVIINVSILEGKLVELFRVSEEDAAQWIGLLGDLLGENESSGDEEEEKKRVCYIHKYSRGIPLLKSVIVNGEPYFLQMKKGGGLDFELKDKHETNTKILKPPQDADSDNCKVYAFDSKEEITQYLEYARKLTDYPNMNFDRIFKQVKTLFDKYVVLDDHYIRLLAGSL